MKLSPQIIRLVISLLLVQVVLSCGLFNISTEMGTYRSISAQVQDCSAVSATVSVSTDPREPSPFLAFCVPSSSVCSGEEEMFKSEQEWIRNKRNLSFSQLISDFGATKDSIFVFSGLTPATDYTVVAYCVDQKKNIVSNIVAVPFTTAEARYGKVGTCIWHDVFVSEYYPDVKGSNIDLPADVYMDTANPGVYTIKSPYSYANIAEWFGVPIEDMRQRASFWKDADICVDASDPQAVKIPLADLGICISDIDGWVSAGSEYDGLLTSVGKLENDTITFPSGGMLKGRSLVQGFSEANLDGEFKITLHLGL